MWSLFDIFRRRIPRSIRTAKANRKTRARRQLDIEMLERRDVPSTYSITQNFNPTAIASNSTIWFASVANSVSGVGSSAATIHVTNQSITFSDVKSGVTTNYNLSLPNADLTLNPAGGSATTTFDSTNNKWVTTSPTGLAGNLFLSGYELALPNGLHSGDSVTWSATFTTDTSGVNFKWAWGAAVYNSFNTTYSSLGIKPCDDKNASSYTNNSDKAGTPESYKTHVMAGATGTGSPNYIGNLSGNTAVTPTFTPVYVTVAGTVYEDDNGTGVYGSGDAAISGVSLTLTGTTSGGQSVTATTTSASDGTYSFATDSNGNNLVAGTYQIAETQPAGFYQGTNAVGTVNGTAVGSLGNGDVISSIVLIAGQNGIGYNFGEINPYKLVSTGYPANPASSNPLANVAFNESEVLAGASVNVANGTFNIFYSDEHAMALGVREVDTLYTGTTVSGSKTVTVTTTGLFVGEAVSGNGIPVGATIASVGATTITLSSNATNGGNTTLTFAHTYTVSTLSTDPGSVVNPAVGTTAATGDQAGTDAAGRMIFPSLYVTDITSNANSTSGDWQNGGTAIAPSAVYGSWKSFVTTVDHTKTPVTITETGDTDPTANGWSLGAGADAVPASISGNNAGYGTEAQWSLSSLYNQGILIPGHNYRFYFIVHDGDQNNSGGDCGQIAYDFTYRGPVTIAGNVYKDVYGNGVDGAGDTGIGGVALSLTGTTATGQSVSATTTTAADGTYTFTTDSNGNLLHGGTYQIAETQPAGYLQGINTVGMVNWSSAFSSAMGNSVHDTVNSASDNILGSGSLDTTGLSHWQKTTGQPGNTDDIADAFGINFADSLTGHTFLLGGLDRYAATANTTVGFWAFHNSVSVNANGTFSGVHTDGDLLITANVSVNGATSISVYRWTGTDAAGSLTLVTPAVGATYLYVNNGQVSVPWSFTDKTSNTSPQAGELVEVGVDLNAVFGLTVPHFTSFLAETRSGNTAGATLLDFALSSLTSVSGSFTADGTLVPTDKIGSIVVNDGQNGINYNFGEVQPVTIGGLVYQDTNGNGALDSGEPGISGVTVSLSGTNNLGQAVTATTTTASDGTYSFTNDSTGKLLAPGTYQLVETHPSGYVAGTTSVGTVNGTTVGSTVSPGTISSITETTGQNGINYNFGEYKPVTIAGTVYQDSNGNNAFDAGEPGIAGVTVSLSGINGLGQSVTATATTAANGTYSFSTDSNGIGLRPGTYQVVETQPSGYLLGAAAAGTVNGASDGTAVSATTISSIVMASAQSGVNYNFGDFKPVTVSGLVYQDTNGNGAFDSGETGMSGVALTLSGTNGLGQSISATTTTAANGTYSFSTDSNGIALRPGTYQVVETQPSGYPLGSASVGTVNGSADGTAVSATKISSIALTSGQSGINYNFSNLQPVTISGLVYQDINGTGVYNSANDTGIAGVTVSLSGTNNLGQSITAAASTAANGTFTFSTDSNGNTLRPGTYTITETAPSGYLLGSAALGTVNGTAAGTVSSATQLTSIALTSGQSGINYRFGDVKAVALSGIVYQDINGTNSYSASDPGIAGVTLTLTGTNGLGQSISATTTSGSNGTYSLTVDSNGNALRPGTYQIVETQPNGFLLGADAVGTVNGTADGTLASATKISSIALTSGQSGINYLFGNVLPVGIGGTVYVDTNGNNAFDSGEPGLAGVTVTLSGTNGLGQSIATTTTTAANGTYSFSVDGNANALRPGSYQITETQPSGYLAGATAVGTVNGISDGAVVTTGQVGSIALTSGQSGINYNFGAVKPVTISGTVYHDNNGNGVMDAGDVGLGSVALTLSGTNGLGQTITATTTTASDGTYSFSADSHGNVLLPGSYQITETTPAGNVQVAANVGTVNGTSDGTEVTPGQITGIGMTSGQNGINYNFGLSVPGAVSGYVYLDFDRDGVLDNFDAGFAGLTVTLTGISGTGQSVSMTTTTDNNGYYIFSGLPVGTYSISIVPPGGVYNPEGANVGTINGASVGTANANLTEIDQVLVLSGQVGLNYDFGIQQPKE